MAICHGIECRGDVIRVAVKQRTVSIGRERWDGDLDLGFTNEFKTKRDRVEREVVTTAIGRRATKMVETTVVVVPVTALPAAMGKRLDAKKDEAP
ncbi:hypothetical protein L1887_36064 [Cichorium endivia]|nr:hypothetical protein L1887_36064 [Cichorium endivia]